MNKIEEIFDKQVLIPSLKDLVDFRKPDIIEAMKQFGEICFEAGRKGYDFFEIQKNPGLYDKHYYKTYEDFLKEIENEIR